MAPSQNGMAQRQNGISQNRSPCKPLPQANEQQPSGSSTAWNGNAMVVTFKLLEGGKRFSAQCGYNLRVIETFKSCKDRNYDVPTKTWSFGIGTHQELLQKLQDMGSIPRCMLIVYAIGPKLGYAAAQAESTYRLTPRNRTQDTAISFKFAPENANLLHIFPNAEDPHSGCNVRNSHRTRRYQAVQDGAKEEARVEKSVDVK
eukprot:2879778-Rhodomonas_salina.1